MSLITLGQSILFFVRSKQNVPSASPRSRKLLIHCIHNTMEVLPVGGGCLWIDECTCLLSKTYGTMLRWLLEWLCDALAWWFINLLFLIEWTLTTSKIGFSEIEKVWLKIKASKCKLFRWEISYLGRLISSEGYSANPKNILAVTSKINKKTQTIRELKTLLGLVGHFRRYIPNFSEIASPLLPAVKRSTRKIM